MESSVRHIVAGLRGADLREAVLFDIRRAARLLDTGLSSLARGAQTGGAQTGGAQTGGAQTGGRSGSG
jgi:hypothetical protein